MSTRYYKYEQYRGYVSRPYKAQGTPPNPHANANASDLGKTLPERIAACKSRVQTHITRVNGNSTIPATQKAAMIKKLTEKLADCSTTRGLGNEEADKEHKDVENIRKGQGQLIRQITPGALRKEPTVLESLIKMIQDFFKNITNRPEVVDRFLEKYPTAPPTTSALAFGVPGTY